MQDFVTTEQHLLAGRAACRALAYLESASFPLGVAWVRHRWQDGPSRTVINALSRYQQPDGGFGGLEVDIKAPVSNPFATRLAMQVMLSLRDRPVSPIYERTAAWLRDSQDPDGDWHFAPEIYQHDLAPWFTSWTFPSLNPACCLASLASALDLATPEMLARVAALWDELASLDDAESGNFYAMLPLIEYVARIDVPGRDEWLDALATGVTRGIASNSFGDAGHALEHMVGGGPDLVARLAPGDICRVVDNVLADQQADGGWPTPYDQAWRPWTTASTMVLLLNLRGMRS